jgi:hypothetical protein
VRSLLTENRDKAAITKFEDLLFSSAESDGGAIICVMLAKKQLCAYAEKIKIKEGRGQDALLSMRSQA